MAVTFADIPVLAPLPNLQEWVDRWVPPDMVPEFAYHVWPGLRQRWLTFPKTTRPKPVRLGVLNWPSGASRWACGHYLVSAAQADAIRLQCHYDADDGAVNKPAVLELTHTDGFTTSTVRRWMYALPLKPLSWDRRGLGDSLYLLTLVDERYFWQYLHTGDLSQANTSTWTDLLEHLRDQLGLEAGEFEIVSAIESVFLNPAVELQQGHSLPVAPMLDAIAYNLGRRFVWTHSPEMGKLLELLTAAESEERMLANRQGEKAVLAGGLWQFGSRVKMRTEHSEAAAILPETVRVLFPACVDECGNVSADLRYVSDQSCEPNGIGTIVFFDRVLAIDSEASPSNQVELDDLAERIADDYKAYQSMANMDTVWLGLWDGEPEGLTDATEWIATFDPDNGAGQMLTRVYRGPWNQVPSELLHRGDSQACRSGGVPTECLFECVDGVPMINTGLLYVDDSGQLAFKPDEE